MLARAVPLPPSSTFAFDAVRRRIGTETPSRATLDGHRAYMRRPLPKGLPGSRTEATASWMKPPLELDGHSYSGVVVLTTRPQNIVPGLIAPAADRETSKLNPDTASVARRARLLGLHPRLTPRPLRRRSSFTRAPTCFQLPSRPFAFLPVTSVTGSPHLPKDFPVNLHLHVFLLRLLGVLQLMRRLTPVAEETTAHQLPKSAKLPPVTEENETVLLLLLVRGTLLPLVLPLHLQVKPEHSRL